MAFACYERTGAIGRITLNRPDRLNAIGGDLLADLIAALQQAGRDDSVSVFILAGAGRAFCSGDDLKEYGDQTTDDAAIEAHVAAIQQVTHLLMKETRPIICAAHGYAVGGGFEWMLNCDLVVAADNLCAFFPEVSLGQFVTGGITHLLPRAIGYQRSMELLLLGERQSATRLERLGLVNFVVPEERMLSRATELADILLSQSAFSVRRLKQALNIELGAGLWQSVAVEQAATVEAFRHPDTAARVESYMRSKRGAA